MWGGFILGMSSNTSKPCASSQNDGKHLLNTPLKDAPNLFIKSKRDHPSYEDKISYVEQADTDRKLTRNEAVRGKSTEVHKDKVSNRLSQEQPSRLIHSLCHKQLSTRGELPSYLTSLGLLGEGVEIGVRDGDFSQWVLSNWEGEKLHLVDPWAHQDVKLYNDKSNVGLKEQDQLHLGVVEMMSSRFPGRFEIHRYYSINAAKNFKDLSLDFIYIDGRHDYAGVKEDVESWYPKLKDGGLFAGHDFVPDGILNTGDFGVQKGVSEFARLMGKEVQSISTKGINGGREEPQSIDGGWTTWYFLK
jgi:hypothetical protein